MQSPVYQEFITDLVQNMEPRFEYANTIVYTELDEITEVIFFIDGQFDIGFEINGKQIFVLRYTNSTTKSKSYGEGIGEHGCTLNKTSRFIYKTTQYCEGYFIRKRAWAEILTCNSYVAKAYTDKINQRHAKQVLKIAKVKKVEIEKLYQTAHVDQYKFVASFESVTRDSEDQFKVIDDEVKQEVIKNLKEDAGVDCDQ